MHVEHVWNQFEKLNEKANHIFNIFGFMLTEGKIAITCRELVHEIGILISDFCNIITSINSPALEKEDFKKYQFEKIDSSTRGICQALHIKLEAIKCEEKILNRNINSSRTNSLDSIEQPLLTQNHIPTYSVPNSTSNLKIR